MKNILVLASILLSLLVNGQDSTQIKLEQYRDLFSKGLITAQEYDQLKGKLLGIEQKPQRVIVQGKESHVLTTQERESFNKKMDRAEGIGAGLTSIGAVGMASGITLTALGLTDLIPKRSGAFFVSGLTLLGVSTVFLIAGPIELGAAKHYRKKLSRESAALSFHPDIINTAIGGYHASPVIAMRIVF